MKNYMLILSSLALASSLLVGTAYAEQVAGGGAGGIVIVNENAAQTPTGGGIKDCVQSGSCAKTDEQKRQ